MRGTPRRTPPGKKASDMHRPPFLPALVLLILLSGCVTTGMTTVGPIPVPKLEQRITSVEYYRKTYNVDLLSKQHDMRKEISNAFQAAYDLGSKIKVNGRAITVTPQTNFMYKSQSIGTNDYTISCTQIAKPEKQKDEEYCWAACVQCLIGSRDGRYIDQETIVARYKSKTDDAGKAGSVADMLRSMGFVNTTLTEAGAMHLVQTLGNNQPVMLGITNQQTGVGHAVLVVGARYSFVNPLLPFLPPSGGVAFSELTIIDPADAEMKTLDMAEYSDRVGFLLSVYTNG